MARVLLVDDDDDVRRAYAELLAEHGYEVVTATNGIEALDAAHLGAPDVVVTDVLMPESDGFDLITELRGSFPDVPVIAISGGGRLEPGGYLQMASMLGAVAVLSKPFRFRQLLDAIEELGIAAG
jgi:CheY-like chemotaxis protein